MLFVCFVLCLLFVSFSVLLLRFVLLVVGWFVFVDCVVVCFMLCVFVLCVLIVLLMCVCVCFRFVVRCCVFCLFHVVLVFY